MNALDYLLADIKAAHRGEKLPRRPTACPKGQAAPAPRPKAKRQAAKPAPAPLTKPAAPETADNPIIARALATLRAEMERISP